MSTSSNHNAYASTTNLSDAACRKRIQKLGQTILVDKKQCLELEPTSGSRADWKERLHALDELAHMLSDGSICTRRSFLRWMSSFVKVPLLNQLEDKRTVIVVRACELVLLLAVHARRDDWEIMCSWFVGPLLALTANSNKQMVHASRDALLGIAAKSILNWESFGVLLKQCSSTHTSTRWHALRVLREVMQRYKGTASQITLAEYSNPIRYVLQNTVMDADANVRRSARQCYLVLASMEPQLASEIGMTFDPMVVKQIEREATGNLLVSPEDGTEAVPGADPNEPLPPPPIIPEQIASRYLEPKRMSAYAVDRTNANNTGSGQANTTKGSKLNDKQIFEDELYGVAAARARRRAASAPFIPPTRPSTSGVMLRHASSAAGNQQTTGADSSLDANKVSAAPPVASVGEVLPLVASADWQLRVHGLTQVQHYLETAKEISTEELFPFLRMLPERMNDVNFHATEAALRCSRLILEKAPLCLSGLLYEVFCALLAHGTSDKEVVKLQSVVQLGRLIRSFEPADVLGALHAALGDVNGMKIHCYGLEVLQRAYELHPSHLSTLSTMGREVRFLLLQLKEADQAPSSRTSSIRLAALRAIATLYHVQPGPMLRVLVQQATPDQVVVLRESLRTLCPRFSRDYQRAAAGDYATLAEQASASNADGTPSPFRELELAAAAAAAAKTEEKKESTGGIATKRHQQQQQRAVATHTEAVPLTTPVDAMYTDPEAETTPSTTTNLFSSSLAPTLFLPPHATTADKEDTWRLGYRRGTTEVSAYTDALLQKDMTAQDLLKMLSMAEETSALAVSLDNLRASLERCPAEWTVDTGTFCLQLLSKHLTEQLEPRRVIRSGAFLCLMVFLSNSALLTCVARQHHRLVLLCRSGIDDSFTEVRQLAAQCLHLATAERGVWLALDLRLNSLATSVEVWQRSAARDDATQGWVELLNEMGRLFERLHTAEAPSSPLASSESRTRRLRKGASPLTDSAMRRVTKVIIDHCLEHCAATVRRTSYLILVAMWFSLKDEVLPYLIALSASQQKLLSIYINKYIQLNGGDSDDCDGVDIYSRLRERFPT